jgi:hypothetical protein
MLISREAREQSAFSLPVSCHGMREDVCAESRGRLGANVGTAISILVVHTPIAPILKRIISSTRHQ